MLSLCSLKFEIIKHRISIVTEVKKNCRIRKKSQCHSPTLQCRHMSAAIKTALRSGSLKGSLEVV